jgi:hypothetical protein
MGQTTSANTKKTKVRIAAIAPRGAMGSTSQRAPSTACCRLNNSGVAASGSSRARVTLLNASTPTAPVSPAVRKLAAGEKHTGHGFLESAGCLPEFLGAGIGEADSRHAAIFEP